MAIQLSVTLRNNRLDQVEATLGTSVKLHIRSGSPPANCAAVNTGTLLAELTLPADWMNAAASGAKTLLGSWTGTGVAANTAAHFRIFESTDTTCHLQGTVTATAMGGDMTLDNTSIAVGQTVTITSFTLTDGNA